MCTWKNPSSILIKGGENYKKITFPYCYNSAFCILISDWENHISPYRHTKKQTDGHIDRWTDISSYREALILKMDGKTYIRNEGKKNSKSNVKKSGHYPQTN